MRIMLAGPRGFCAGVNMAIESLELAIRRFGTPVYVYHEIVHNKWVVAAVSRPGRRFRRRSGRSARGCPSALFGPRRLARDSPQAAERHLETIDATCPLVTKVHREAMRYAREGYTIVLIGHAGTTRWSARWAKRPRRSSLVDSPEDVDRLEVADPEKMAYLTQTTLSIDDAERIIERLRQRFPRIVGPSQNDICYATQNRQEAVLELAREADFVLVVGSQNSSNSQRLAELCRASGVATRLIDGPADIDPGWFAGRETVLVTAGASAPEDVVQECVRLLEDRFGATVESRVIRDEEVRFPLPRELTQLT